jgi:hypothetical protein
MTPRGARPSRVSLDRGQDFLRREAARIDADAQTNCVCSLGQTLLRKPEPEEVDLELLPALAEEVRLTLQDERAGQFRRQHSGAGDTAPESARGDQLRRLSRGRVFR